MNIVRKKKPPVDIANSGSLSDLAFLLIVFFIVIAVFNINSGFLLGLPRKDSTKLVNIEEVVKVVLGRDGSLTREGEPVTMEELRTLVIETRRSRPNMTFLLRIVVIGARIGLARTNH